jgi:hypothetical protein
MGDSIETAKTMIDNVHLMEFLTSMRKTNNGPLRILDPCYSKGGIKKVFKSINHQQRGIWDNGPFVHLVHLPNMCVGGTMEVNEANLPKFKRYKIDLILTNPPWSVDALAGVLGVMQDLARFKEVPLLFLIPFRCARTEPFRDIFKDQVLFMLICPRIKFQNQGWNHDSSLLTWYASNINAQPSVHWGSDPVRMSDGAKV